MRHAALFGAVSRYVSVLRGIGCGGAVEAPGVEELDHPEQLAQTDLVVAVLVAGVD
jgi:hypothetical protein